MKIFFVIITFMWGYFATFYNCPSEQKKGEYKYSVDWFKRAEHIFEKHLKEFKGKKNLKYLEVGVYEGRSFFWVMDNILSDSSTKGFAIDLFEKEAFDAFKYNLKAYGKAQKVRIKKGYSSDILPKLKGKFDIIYIDGSHVAVDVLEDMIYSWKLLKEGGVLIMDDYILGKGFTHINLRPQVAIDSFLTIYSNDLEILYLDEDARNVTKETETLPYPAVFKKVPNICKGVKVEFFFPGNIYSQCTRIDKDHAYLWTKRELLKTNGKKIKLDEKQWKCVEDILINVSFAQVKRPEVLHCLK